MSLKKILITIGSGFLMLVFMMLMVTMMNSSKQIHLQPIPKIDIDEDLVAEHFSKALQIKTISDPSQFNGQTFKRLHQLLEEFYPLVHHRLQREVVNEYSLLYTWKGTNPALKPIQLMGHIDAAPTEEGVAEKWTYPPFSGAIADGYVWGRGAMHSKLNVITLLEAVELLLKQNFNPSRTIYLAFGHDDDVLGDQGAAKIGQLLKSRGVELEYVLEEGGMILDGIVEGVPYPIAQVAVAEKGYLSIELNVTGKGGHSSMVPEKTAIGILAGAVLNLESYEFPPKISGASEMMLRCLAPEMPFHKKFVISNLWLLRPLIAWQFSKKVATNAFIRTTFATTVIKGGVKDNLLPVLAQATANIRIIPGDTVQGTLKKIKEVVDDPRVEITVKGHLAIDSQKMLSHPDQWGYKMIEKTIRQLYPNVIVAPSQLTAITDAGNYKELTQNLYRFQPSWICSIADTRRVHGIDERTSVDNLEEFVGFYVQLISNSASSS